MWTCITLYALTNLEPELFVFDQTLAKPNSLWKQTHLITVTFSHNLYQVSRYISTSQSNSGLLWTPDGKAHSSEFVTVKAGKQGACWFVVSKFGQEGKPEVNGYFWEDGDLQLRDMSKIIYELAPK